MAGEPKVRDGFGRGENRRVGINNHALIFQISRYGVNELARSYEKDSLRTRFWSACEIKQRGPTSGNESLLVVVPWTPSKVPKDTRRTVGPPFVLVVGLRAFLFAEGFLEA